MDKITVICMLYNSEKYIDKLINGIKKQKNVETSIYCVLTESSDNTEKTLKELSINYEVVKKEEFNHSLAREKVLLNCVTDYAVMLSHDVELVDEECFSKMINQIRNNDLAVTYAKQRGFRRGLDSYYRMISYSDESKIFTKSDLEIVGLHACYCSDVCACYDVKKFKELGGYGKALSTNEDMYYAYKCLSNGYKKGYCADAVVKHYHKINLKSTKARYTLIGQFFKSNPEIDKLSGGKGKYFKVILYALCRFDIIALIQFPFDVMARMIGLRKGRKL